MKSIEIINKSKCLFLESAQVLESNDLVLSFVIGLARNKPKNTIIGEQLSVDYDDQFERYRMTFNNFVGYSILNELYDNMDTSDVINFLLSVFRNK